MSTSKERLADHLWKEHPSVGGDPRLQDSKARMSELHGTLGCSWRTNGSPGSRVTKGRWRQVQMRRAVLRAGEKRSEERKKWRRDRGLTNLDEDEL